jgi:hypothetical protein
MEERIMKKTIGGLLMWVSLIMFVCECNHTMSWFILSKIFGAIVGYIGYILLLRGMSKGELNEEV